MRAGGRSDRLPNIQFQSKVAWRRKLTGASCREPETYLEGTIAPAGSFLRAALFYTDDILLANNYDLVRLTKKKKIIKCIQFLTVDRERWGRGRGKFSNTFP